MGVFAHTGGCTYHSPTATTDQLTRVYYSHRLSVKLGANLPPLRISTPLFLYSPLVGEAGGKPCPHCEPTLNVYCAHRQPVKLGAIRPQYGSTPCPHCDSSATQPTNLLVRLPHPQRRAVKQCSPLPFIDERSESVGTEALRSSVRLPTQPADLYGSPT